MRPNQALSTFALCSALLFSGLPAFAASVDCSQANAEFTLDTTIASTCLASGMGNISGNTNGNGPNRDPFLTNPNFSEYVLLDKSDDSTSGVSPNSFFNDALTSNLGGTFDFIPPVGYENFAIGFKKGGNQNQQVVWAVFGLADGITSGSWLINGQNALSHANLYGTPGTTMSAVPLPAAAWLFLTGLAWLGGLKKWQLRSKAV